MGHKTPTIPSTLAPEERHEHRPTVNAKQETTRRTTMMTKTMTMALCACLAAMLLASPALANRNLLAGHEGHSDGDDHSHSDDMTIAMNDTMMNMTMNGTDEMANDTIAEAPEEMPSSDGGRRKLLQLEGLQDSVTGVVDKAKDTAANAKDKVTDVANKAVDKATEIVDKANATLQAGVDKVNDFIGSAAGNVSALANETEGNMTMNGTEMADDEIEGEEMPEEMPASDDGRRKLLEGHEGHSDDMTMDMMNDTMMNMTMNGTEMADDAIEGEDAEEMPATDDGRRKLLEGDKGHSDDDTMDMMNDTMMNMTMNATEMANDTITDAAEEMPASDDGRRKLLL